MRALLRSSIMPGSVEVAFTREPRHAAGSGLAGAVDRTLLYRDGSRLDGVGRLSVLDLWRGGLPQRVGYFGDLRVRSQARRPARILRDGYRILCEAAEELGVAGCFTSIATDNDRARRVLERGRRIGLPEYLPIADLVTLVVPVRRPRAPFGDPAPKAHATESELTSFLDGVARGHDLALVWNTDRWRALGRHGLSPTDFHVVREEGRVVAAAGLWDQRPFKQTVIHGYHGALRWSRPLVNPLAALGWAPPLPPPGAVLSQGYLVGAVTHARHWPGLLRALKAGAARRRLDWMVLSRDARDPELATLRKLTRAREYHTRLYEVRWGELPNWTGEWGERFLRPEAALL